MHTDKILIKVFVILAKFEKFWKIIFYTDLKSKY